MSFSSFTEELSGQLDIKEEELAPESSSVEPKSELKNKDEEMVSSVLVNADSESLNDSVLELQDERHPQLTLASLNMMRKNRHFCDVVLHVSSMNIHLKNRSTTTTTTTSEYYLCAISPSYIVTSVYRSFANPRRSLQADVCKNEKKRKEFKNESMLLQL